MDEEQLTIYIGVSDFIVLEWYATVSIPKITILTFHLLQGSLLL